MTRVPAGHRARSHGDVLAGLIATARVRFAGVARTVELEGARPAWDPGRRIGAFDVDLGRGLLDSVAVALHVLWTYQQAWAEEGYLATARLGSSVDKLLGQLGYRPRPGVAATGFQHFRCKSDTPGVLPAGFPVLSPARGEQPDARFETLEPVRLDPLLNEVRAFLPPSGTTSLPQGGGLFSAGDGEPGVPDGGLFGDGSVLAALQDRLDAARHGPLVDRRVARARQKARDLARMIAQLDHEAQAACKGALHGLCAKLCEAQNQASRAATSDAPVGSLSESQEILARQLRNLNRRQLDAIEALEAAMKRCDEENREDWARRLDALARFLDAFVGSLIQEARDQLVLLRGVEVLSRLDDAFGGGGALRRGVALPGTDALFVPPLIGGDGAVGDLPIRVGDWLAVGLDVTRVDAEGKTTVERRFREAVRVVRVTREVPSGELQAMQRVQFTPPLAGRYPLDRTVLVGNLAPISHGAAVTEDLTPSPDRRTARLGHGPLAWLRDPTRPSGRATQLTVAVGGRAWREVDDLLSAGADEAVFAVEPAPGGGVRVRFGDGENGAMLPAGARVSARYRIGLGRAGNRAPGRIDGLGANHPSVESTLNPIATTGGVDPEDGAQSRRLGPLAIGAIDRAVSLDDVVALCRAYDGISRARIVRDPRRPRQFGVVVAGTGGRALDGPELDALATYLRARVAPGITLTVENRALVRVRLAMLVRYRRGSDPIALVKAVRDRLGADDAAGGLLDPDRVELGDDLPLSAIYGALDGLAGLHSAVVRTLYRTTEPPALRDQIVTSPRELLAWALPDPAAGDGVAISYEEGVDL